MNEIDWETLARQLGLLHERGESGSSDAAKRALELIVSEGTCRAAVDYYIAGRRGSELARMVLWQLHPWSAMEYCYEIFKSARPLEDRRSAVELLRAVADGRALAWVSEFLLATANFKGGVQECSTNCSGQTWLPQKRRSNFSSRPKNTTTKP